MSPPLIPVVLFLSIVSLLGVYTPRFLPSILPHLPTIRPFSTGVVLSISLCHLLPDASKEVEKGIVKPEWMGCFPIPEGCMVLGFILMVIIESLLPCPHQVHIAVQSHASVSSSLNPNKQKGGYGDGKCRSLSCDSTDKTQSDNPTESTSLLPTRSGDPEDDLRGPPRLKRSLTQELYKLHVLEFSIALHSVLIGLPVTSKSNNALLAALGIHQYFEGVSLGLAGVSAGMRKTEFRKLAALFSCSISVGVAIGYMAGPGGGKGGAVTGVANCVAAGILLFVAVEFYVQDFGELGHGGGSKIGKIASLTVGATLMGAVAIWT